MKPELRAARPYIYKGEPEAPRRPARTSGGGRSGRTPAERFHEKCLPIDDEGCILWNGAINSRGYGCFGFGKSGQSVLAHKFAYEHLEGHKVSEGFVLAPVCGKKLCVNPMHMFMTTRKSSILLGPSIGGVNGRATHCAFGHELAGPNVRIRTDGRRRCVKCNKRMAQEWRDAKKGSGV